MKRPWVTDDEAALLRTSLATGDEARRHWAEFTTLHPFEDIWDSGRYALLPACHVALRGADDVPEAPRLAGIHRRTWVRSQTALTNVAAASSRLGSADVVHCVHGELAVALSLYDDLASRLVDAPEILVTVADVGAAIEVLGAFGWSTPTPVDENRLVVDDGITLVRHDDRLRLSWETCRGVAASARDRETVPHVIARSVEVATPHGVITVTAPADLAAVALCGGTGAGPDHRLRTLADVARILVDDTQLTAIARRIAELHTTTAALHVLTTVQTVVGLDATRHIGALAALPVRTADRRRHELLLRAVAPAETLHPLYGILARSTVGLGVLESAQATPKVLRAVWDLDSHAALLTEIPKRAARKAVRSIRAAGANR